MSEVLASYDRDRNVNSPVASGSFVPEYGSVVLFEYANKHFYSADNNYIKFSKGLNGTRISFDLKFSNKTEVEANSLLHLFEEVELSESGNLDFNTLSSSGVEIAFPTGSIYKNLENTKIKNYSFGLSNNLFTLDLSLVKDDFSYFLNWKGSSYLNTGNFQTGWDTGISYEKFDIVYYPEYLTGSNSNFFTHVNRIEKFYYSSSGHTSTEENSPTGENSLWTRSFFYDIDDDVSLGFDKSNNLFNFDNSFTSFNKKNSNNGLIKDLTLTLKNRSNKETRSIIHFIEKHENYRPFEVNLPQLYSKRKFFVAKSMKHTFVYKDCNDIEIVIDEVVRYKNEYFLDSFYHAN